MPEVEITWWKGARGILTVKGRRLDGPGGVLRVPLHGTTIVSPSPWADGITEVSTGVDFPTEGCWEITGTIDDLVDSALTFVVDVRMPR